MDGLMWSVIAVEGLEVVTVVCVECVSTVRKTQRYLEGHRQVGFVVTGGDETQVDWRTAGGSSNRGECAFDEAIVLGADVT